MSAPVVPLGDLFAVGYVVIAFNSHRARTRGIGRTHGYPAVWSVRRASKGGYYVVPPDAASYITANITGATKLRAPYDDLGRCWS